MSKTILEKTQYQDYINLEKYMSKPKLQFYTSSLRGEQKLKEIPYYKDGNIKIQLGVEKKGVQYLFELAYSEERKKELINASAKLCTCETPELSFYFNSKRYLVLQPYLLEQIGPHTEGLSIEQLTEEQRQRLACLASLAEKDIRVRQQAYLWIGEATALVKPLYIELRGTRKGQQPESSFEGRNWLFKPQPRTCVPAQIQHSQDTDFSKTLQLAA